MNINLTYLIKLSIPHINEYLIEGKSVISSITTVFLSAKFE